MSQPRRALTLQQQRDLVVAAGDPEGSRRLVDAFLPSIAGLAGRFPTGAGVEFQELVQEGVAGLLYASRRYDSRLGTPFWAYASFWVRKAMQELVAELTRPVALSDRAVRGLARIKAARSEHVQAHGAEPTTDELGEATGFTQDQILSLQAAERAPRAMEEPLGLDDCAGSTVGDTVVDPGAERAYEQVLDRIEASEVRELAEELDERERTVIRAHFGLGRPAETLNEIGGELGLTAERTRQIEAGALTKLAQALVVTS
jgi:RNA polymerase primary sigma factor